MQHEPIRFRADEKDEFDTPERCRILEMSRSADDPDLSLARARVAPGVTTALHRLKVHERYVILSGEGRVEIGEADPLDVRPGDVVRIPAGTSQRIANTGAEDLVFLCVCTPAFSPEAYEDLEGDA
jgi:mannose-6-phosphate isomerase-like protein (cupin superfamily)